MLVALSRLSWETIRPPFEQISGLALQGVANLIQDFSAVPFGSAVKHRGNRWIGNVRFLLQPVLRPAPLPQDLL